MLPSILNLHQAWRREKGQPRPKLTSSSALPHKGTYQGSQRRDVLTLKFIEISPKPTTIMTRRLTGLMTSSWIWLLLPSPQYKTTYRSPSLSTHMLMNIKKLGDAARETRYSDANTSSAITQSSKARLNQKYSFFRPLQHPVFPASSKIWNCPERAFLKIIQKTCF